MTNNFEKRLEFSFWPFCFVIMEQLLKKICEGENYERRNYFSWT